MQLTRASKDGEKFLNPVPTTVGGFRIMRKVLPLYLSNREEAEPKHQLGPFRTDRSLYDAPPPTGLRVTWFGHSSLLVEIDGLRILIDPVWEQRASPVEWFGPKRFFPPTLALQDLPTIDTILISHDHYDHFGSETVHRLARLNATARARWVTSLGVGKRLRKRGVAEGRIAELDWTQSVQVSGAEMGQSIQITSWPARHFSGRGLTDRFKTLWASFVLEGPKHRVYFGADSGVWEGFTEIAAKYNRFDLTMLEIGAFHPLWSDIHMGPDGAAEAYSLMGGPEKAGMLMPIHWGLFNLALHGWRQPMERLTELAAAGNIPLWSPVPGVPTDFVAGQPSNSTWWQGPGLASKGE
ncbi:MAG TPA: MBL fold metallo-hydrolase [Acidobacteriaceae bacterium]|jgi:L-ascorbate metabolism protein UlaG (beta-lactamase superfamily)